MIDPVEYGLPQLSQGSDLKGPVSGIVDLRYLRQAGILPPAKSPEVAESGNS